MKIEFETDINGYQEARKFKLLVNYILKQMQLDSSLHSLVSSLRTQAQEFLSNPTFFTFGSNVPDYTDISLYEASASNGFKLLRNIFGPGKHELELSKQRQDLVMRVERAEASAFETLAEMTEIARERDRLKEKLKQLYIEKAEWEKNT